MAGFAAAPESREQAILFPQKLDEVIPMNHRVRLFDDIMGRIDWSSWEGTYHRRLGQPPIHPRVLAAVVLYGMLTRIQSSRQLEEALQVRIDFRWLVEGRSIDHTTINAFRKSNNEELIRLFQKIGMIALNIGHLPLKTLGFDGTRIRANNRRSRTRTPEELAAAKREFARQFAEAEAKAAAADAREDEEFEGKSRSLFSGELADLNARRKRVDAALNELEKSESKASRIPLTDPESRVTPNKEGGFAPNYTPLATVDIDSGLIVAVDVIAHTDEDKYVLAAVDEVRKSFGIEDKRIELLTDGLNCTGENLFGAEQNNIDFYSPIKLGKENNPAERSDLSQPVAEKDWDALPTKTTTLRDGTSSTKLDKDAFIYVEEHDEYMCPNGKPLAFSHKTREFDKGRRRERFRYRSNPADCAGCPLAQRCLGAKHKTRVLTHEQHEGLRRAHSIKMKRQESKDKYARRRHAGERPFAVIKSQFGVRQFSRRGLTNVRNEWRWLACAFNISRLMTLMSGSGADPPAAHLSTNQI